MLDAAGARANCPLIGQPPANSYESTTWHDRASGQAPVAGRMHRARSFPATAPGDEARTRASCYRREPLGSPPCGRQAVDNFVVKAQDCAASACRDRRVNARMRAVHSLNKCCGSTVYKHFRAPRRCVSGLVPDVARCFPGWGQAGLSSPESTRSTAPDSCQAVAARPGL